MKHAAKHASILRQPRGFTKRRSSESPNATQGDKSKIHRSGATNARYCAAAIASARWALGRARQALLIRRLPKTRRRTGRPLARAPWIWRPPGRLRRRNIYSSSSSTGSWAIHRAWGSFSLHSVLRRFETSPRDAIRDVGRGSVRKSTPTRASPRVSETDLRRRHAHVPHSYEKNPLFCAITACRRRRRRRARAASRRALHSSPPRRRPPPPPPGAPS